MEGGTHCIICDGESGQNLSKRIMGCHDVKIMRVSGSAPILLILRRFVYTFSVILLRHLGVIRLTLRQPL